jgi:hypothetical protein
MIIKGRTYIYAGEPHRCTMVNDCRAVLVPVNKVRTEVKPQTGVNAGKTVIIDKVQPGANISPNSELEEVR